MRKINVLLALLILAALVLTACGGEENNTAVASPPPVTVDATDDMSGTATEPATEAATEPATTETAGVPVTGDADPARLSNQLEFTVWSQDGEQIGDVNDMVLDLDNSRVAYVVVGTGGFLDLGEREILVPRDQLQTGTGDTTGGQQNAFILQTDLDVFRNAPDFDIAGNLPEMGQPAADWDVDVRTYWESGGTTGGNTGAGTDQATATAETGTTDQATATAGTGTDQATATVESGAGTGQDTGTRTGQGSLQGVVLATEVIGSTITLGGAQGAGTGTDTDLGQATATADGTGQATAAPNATAEGTATAGTGGTDTGQAPTTGTIDDMITDVDTGEILYLVVTAAFTEGERWIPVPLGMFGWDVSTGAFMLDADATVLQNAPFFQDGQFPDTTISGWNSEFDTFWQNNNSGGTGTGAQPTATP